MKAPLFTPKGGVFYRIGRGKWEQSLGKEHQNVSIDVTAFAHKDSGWLRVSVFCLFYSTKRGKNVLHINNRGQLNRASLSDKRRRRKIRRS